MKPILFFFIVMALSTSARIQLLAADGLHLLTEAATGKDGTSNLVLKYVGPHRPSDANKLITDADLAALTQHPQIRDVQSIIFDGLMMLDGSGLDALGELPKLKSVSFNGTAFKAVPFGPAGFEALAKRTTLERVYFQHTIIPISGAVKLLESLSELQHFIPASIADDAILAAAAKVPKLQTLQFGHWATQPLAPLTMNGFSHYREMKALEKLVTGTVVPKDGDYAQMFAVLVDMPNLRDLHFSFGIAILESPKQSGITLAPVKGKNDPKPAVTADLVVLAKAAKLTSLRLSHGTLADGALLALKDCTPLKSVSFDGTDVPAADIAAFKLARPDIKVIIVDRTPKSK